MKIIPMTQQSLDDVIAIENTCFSTPWSRASFEYAVDSESSDFFVAYDKNNSPVGYIGFTHLLDEGDIASVAILPQCRGNGYSKLLMKVVLEKCSELSIKKLFLEVRASNNAAQGLYKSFGFVENGLRKNYYSEPTEDAITMIKVTE